MLLIWLRPLIYVSLAVVGRSVLDPWLGDQIPFGFFILAVVLSAMSGGFCPALLASILSALAADFFFLEPRHTIFTFHGPEETAALAVFIGISGVISYFGYRLQLGRAKLEKSYDALEKSERRYRVVADNTDSWEFWVDPQGAFLYNSPSCERITGFRPEEFANDPELFDRIICPEDRHCFEEHHGKDPGEGCATEEADFRVVRRDGGLRWIHHVCRPVYDTDGKYLGVRGSNRDITERKESEDALQKSEARFRGTFENAAVGMSHTDREGRLLAFNDKLCEMLGFPRPELSQMGFQEVTSSDDLPKDWEQYARMMRGECEGYHVEERYIRKDGTVIWLEIERSLQRDSLGQPDYSINVLQEVTARKQIEEELARQRRLYESILNNTPDLAYVFDLNHRFIYVNEGLLKLWDKTHEEAIGKNCLELGYEPWHAEMHDREIDRVVETKQPIRGVVPFSGSLGRRIYDYIFVPVLGEDGRVEAVAGTTRDVTELKRTEDELRAAQVSAERARAAAEQANTAKDQFLAVLSHELRTPLTPVLAAVQLMQRNKELSEDGQHHVEIIRRNLELEARLIDDLLDLTRIVRGKLLLDRKAVNICTAVQRVAEMCGPDIEAKRLHFRVDLKDKPLVVNGDLSRLQQIIWNLLKNSVKFTVEGGSIRIRGYRGQGRVYIEVTDSGLGIEPDLLPRIFDAFEQGDKRVTRQFGGLGLGLAITKRLVELHDGTISAESPGKGKGATFQVSLPEFTMQPQIEAAIEHAPVRHRAGARILLVEDHADTAAMIQALLSSSGYSVETACDARQALEAAAREQFELLISDLGLPDRSGADLIRELRQRGRITKAIALSGYGREEDVRRSKEAGFEEHLTKPVDFDVLLEAVERVV